VFSVDTFFVFYIYNTHLYARIIDPATGAGSETTLINSASLADNAFDACSFPVLGLATALVVYRWADATTSLRAIGVTAGPTVAFGPTNLVAEATVAVANIQAVAAAMFPDGLHAAGFILHTGGISGTVIDQNWSVTKAVTNVDAYSPAAGNSHITATTSGTSLRVFADQQANYGTAGINTLRAVSVSSALAVTTAAATLINSASFGTAGGAARGPQGPWICGKAFTSSAGLTFLPVCVMENAAFGSGAPSNNTQSSFFLLDGSTGKPLAKALYGAYGVPAINSNTPVVNTPCGTANISGDRFAVVVNERIRLDVSNGLNVSPVGLCRLDLMPNITTPPLKAQLGPVAFLSGGMLSAYDGLQMVEHGFPLSPEGVGAVIAGGAGMTDGVHQIVAVYEWVDGQGQRHQSSPSLAVSVTAGGGSNQATVKVPTLLLSQKSGVYVVLYMTQAGGLVFNRLTLRSGHPVANDTTAAFITVTVTEADTAIVGNEALYTQPNQGGTTLPNDCPPPCSAIGISQNRLWLLDEDSNAFHYSQPLLTNFGLQFSGLYGDTTLGGVLPTESGGGVMVQEMDEKTIILCNNKLYAVFGTPPDSSGENNGLSDPQPIASDVGCSEARSVLAMPNGIIFKSQKGWHLLGRDLSVQYIGEGVAAYDANDVTSAVLLKDRKECRFTSSSGTTLVYSYLVGQWSTFSCFTSYPVADMVWWSVLGSVVHISTSGGLNKDVVGKTYDDTFSFTSGIKWVARTGWLAVASLEGFQRVRRMYLTATGTSPTVTVDLAVDFDDAYGQVAPGAYTATAHLDGTSIAAGMPIDIGHALHRQKCKSVAFTFTGNSNGDETLVPVTGIQALVLEVGIRRGTNKLPAAQTV
jgi:hypothetical protein